MPVNETPVPDVAGEDLAPESPTTGPDLPSLNIDVKADPNGLPVVVLVVGTEFGVQGYPLGADFAAQVAALMAAEAAKASAGIVVAAPSRLILPGR